MESLGQSSPENRLWGADVLRYTGFWGATEHTLLKRILLGAGLIGFICLNMFVTKFGMDFAFIILFVIALLMSQSGPFLRAWFPPMCLFYIYEALRGAAYSHVARPLGIEPITQPLIWAELKLFFFLDEVPTVKLQHWLRPNALKPAADAANWYDYVLFFCYSMFYCYWVVVGFILWIKRRQLFSRYMYGLVGFSLFDVIVYAFLPTSPPWAAGLDGSIPPVARVLWTIPLLPSDTLSFVSTYGHNDFAAFPSHHAAWPFFSCLFMVKAFGKKAMFTFLIPLSVAFATWYGAEHYVIDSLAGFAVAGIAYVFAIHGGTILRAVLTRN